MCPWKGLRMKNGSGVPLTKEVVELKDPMEQAMVVLFMIQFMKHVSIQDLKKELLHKVGVKMHMNTLRATCKALKKGQFITQGLEETAAGDSKDMVSIRTLVYRTSLEVAHVKDLLPRLLATEGAEKIKSWFEDEEKAKNSKARSGPNYKHMHELTLEALLLSDLIGSQIGCQRLNAIRKKFPAKSIENHFVMRSASHKAKKAKAKGNGDDDLIIEVSGLFARCPITGVYLLTSDVLRGWWKSNAMRYADLAEGTGEQAAFAPVRIDPADGNVTQNVLPVNSARGSSTPKAYECISAGERIQISFAHPTTGLLHPAQIELLVILACLRPKRGFSPSRGIRYGNAFPTSFTDHGPINGMDPNHCGPPPQAAFPNERAHLLNGLPPEYLRDHGAYLKDALKRLSTVGLGDGVAKGKNAPAPFPVPSSATPA